MKISRNRNGKASKNENIGKRKSSNNNPRARIAALQRARINKNKIMAKSEKRRKSSAYGSKSERRNGWHVKAANEEGRKVS
jgi:hypothetical protein